jgi:protein-S-isoprenylcysteine O-methyltransferase
MDGRFLIPNQVLWASYMSWFVMEMWILSRDIRRFRGRKADRGSFWGFFICIPTALYIASVAPRSHHEWAIMGPQPALIWIGIAMMWAGMAFRLWAVLTLGAFFRTSVVVQDGHQLVTAGPYRWLRHPSYTGVIVTMTGLGLAIGNWGSLAALAILPTLAIAWRMHVEERALTEQFGEAYRDFRKTHAAVIPVIW